MKTAMIRYRAIAVPWVCLAVYFWLLELRAALGTDSEPIMVWFADCAAILLNLVFWILLFCIPLALAGLAVGATRLEWANGSAVKAALVLVTALHFVRWLLNWQSFVVGYDLGLIILALAALSLAICAIKRRRTPRTIPAAPLPSMGDCFTFGALPLLFVAMVVLTVRVVGDRMSLAQNATAVASASNAVGDPRQPSMILVVADALRAQSMSLYGYSRATTPNLERWARSATVYLENHTNSTSTKPSMTTIVTGKHPLSHGRLTKGQPPDRSGENLLQILRDHGFYVGAVTSNEDASLNLLGFGMHLSVREYPAFEHLTLSWLRQLGIYPTATGGRIYQSLAQFLPFMGFPRRTSFYGSADDTLTAAAEFVAHARRPFFLLVHLHEPHDPYDAPSPFRGIYSAQTRRASSRKLSSSHYARYDPDAQPEVDSYRDEYDESVRYLDEALGKFLGEIDRALGRKKVVIAITADHGESFERGYMNHGADLFESSVHVPLLIRFPSQERGARLQGLSQPTDIARTFLSAADIAAPGWMEGRVLHPEQAPNSESTLTLNFDDPVTQKTFEAPTNLALFSKGYKLIQNCETGQAFLFHLAEDPFETTDQSRTNGVLLKQLQAGLEKALAGQVKGPKVTCRLTGARS